MEPGEIFRIACKANELLDSDFSNDESVIEELAEEFGYGEDDIRKIVELLSPDW